MTLKESSHILSVVEVALRSCGGKGTLHFQRLSELRGFNVFQIDNAIKLQVAKNVYAASLFKDPSMIEHSENFIKKTEAIPHLIISTFVADCDIDALKAVQENTPEWTQKIGALLTKWEDGESPDYQRFRKLEVVGSFAGYCRYIGVSNPFFWEKVYAHLGLKYNSLASGFVSDFQRTLPGNF